MHCFVSGPTDRDPFEAKYGKFGEALERLNELSDNLDGSISQGALRELIDRLS